MSNIGQRFEYMDDLISAEEAAAILGISHRTVKRLAKSGKIAGKFLSKQWALSRASVLEYQKAQQGQKEE